MTWLQKFSKRKSRTGHSKNVERRSKFRNLAIEPLENRRLLAPILPVPAVALVANELSCFCGQQTVELTASVTGGNGTPSGQVEFKDAGTVIATESLSGSGAAATAFCNVSFSTPGSHSLTADYLGNSNYQGTTSAAIQEVVNNYVQINTSTGTILFDGENASTFYGAPFNVAVGTTKNPITTIYVAGDLNIGPDEIVVTGSYALSIVAGDNATISPGAVFEASANAATPGPGGGSAGSSIAGGGGGGGAASTGPNPGGVGVSYVTNSDGATGGTAPEYYSWHGTSGSVYTTSGNSGDGGYNNSGGGAGGTITVVDNEGTLAWTPPGASGGLGGSAQLVNYPNGVSTVGHPGNNGASGATGNNGGNGAAGGDGKGGANSVATDTISGGGGGGGGNGGQGGGGGASGVPGSGGGGGGSGGALVVHDPAGYTYIQGGNSGNGGTGGAGGVGGVGGAGGNGAQGGAGGGAIEIEAYGQLNVGQASFDAQGGNGTASVTTVGATGGPQGGGGGSGGGGGGSPPAEQTPGGATPGAVDWIYWAPGPDVEYQAGDGGSGGYGGNGGTGGTGGNGAPGGNGAGGAGGSVELLGSVVDTAGTDINTSGGTGGTPGSNDGGSGRLLVGSNVTTTFAGQEQGAQTPQIFNGPSDSNPFLGGTSSPIIPGLYEGAEAYGVTGLTAQQALSSAVIQAAPAGASAVIVRENLGPGSFDYNFSGYDMLLYVNLTDQPISSPEFSVGSVALQPLLQGGYLTNPLFNQSASGPQVLGELGAYQVYATLVPSGAALIKAGATIGGSPADVSAELTNGENLYVVPAAAVTGLSPAAGPLKGGTTVTITGTDLAAATAVDFGSTAAAITNLTATQITVTSPAGTGTVNVTVVTPSGNLTSPTQFSYVAAPVVTGIGPTSGSTLGGTAVTITGTNLAGATVVDFGSTVATITNDTATQITATSPAGTGTVYVTVTTPGGTSGTTSADKFTYTVATDPWVFAGTGDFMGPGTTDLLWFNQTTGAVEAWKMSNGAVTGGMGLGSADPSQWKLLGIADFTGQGSDDILWLNQSTGLVGAWLISNGAVAGWAVFGPVDLSQWQFAGIGKFKGASNPADVLWFNQTSGYVVSWIIQNAAVTSGPVLGTADPSTWKVVGVGNFEDNGTDDILWQNQSTGIVGAWVISNAAVTGWDGLGSADPSAWKLIAIGDLGNGTPDLVWQNQSTNLVGAWIINNGAVTGWASFGPADPTQWQILGGGNLTGHSTGTADVVWRNLSSGLVESWIIQGGGVVGSSNLGPA